MELAKNDLKFLVKKADEYADQYFGAEHALQVLRPLKPNEYAVPADWVGDDGQTWIDVTSKIALVLYPLADLTEKKRGHPARILISPRVDDNPCDYVVYCEKTNKVIAGGLIHAPSLVARNREELKKLFIEYAQGFDVDRVYSIKLEIAYSEKDIFENWPLKGKTESEKRQEIEELLQEEFEERLQRMLAEGSFDYDFEIF